MGSTALHAERGRLDASQDDLGCAWEWPAIHRARPRVLLVCPECGHGMHPKVSSGGLRFFAHDAGAPQCALAQESMEHHLLKLELAQAVRASGWFAELEVRAADGAWRADVMAASPDGDRRMAWEAQLSPITPDEIRARTGRFAKDGVRVCWVGVRSRPWLGTVPSVLVAPPGTDGTPWKVVGGLARFDSPNWLPANATLRDFVTWVLADRVVGHRFGRAQQLDGRTFWPAAWTAPRYIADAAEWDGFQRKLDEQRVQAMGRQLQPGTGWRGMMQTPRYLLRDPHRVMVRSWRLSVPADERRLMREAATTWVLAHHGTAPYFGHEDYDPRWAGGIPLCVGHADGPIVALLRPKPSLLQWEQLAGITVLAASEPDREKLAAIAPRGVHIIGLPAPC
ncbi:competence protein CoiA family protein [Kitasatospora sp. NPDC085895]|uniref:competence protein CoiA n=1 Tax=Kitasatospora sp. NPDC085895 TaxID=3155057 RepID=UPI0034507EA6